MPHLTLPLSKDGPLILLYVGVSAPRRIVLEQQGRRVPAWVRINGLIDTGAECTLVEASALLPLQIEPRGSVDISTVMTGDQPARAAQYDVDLRIDARSSAPGTQNATRTFSTVPVVAASLQNQGVQALIGRDILSHYLFVYDGQAGTFAIAI